MTLRIYNTLTRTKEEFKPLEPGKVGMYVCGPTVYKPSHVGHMVGPVIFDTVKRYLAYQGYQVTWVVNITDVDDKLIAAAARQNTTVPELATRMTADYLDCLKRLNVTGIDRMPKATEYIGEMIRMMQGLIERGHAYAAGGDVYFDISKDEDYGKLCNRDPDQLSAGARIEVSEKKRNPGDFALWKGVKPGEPSWDSPWGPGRPGWHIECSAMSLKLLGKTFDIHGGGLDLQFPHHENELAQSESYTGQRFSNYWMHNGLLKMGSGKMAGSIGNVLNVADALKHVSGEVLRFFTLSTHYRSPIDLGEWDPRAPGSAPIPPGLESARRAYDTFVRFSERYLRVTGQGFHTLAAPTRAVARRQLKRHEFTDYMTRFIEHMNDDFNTGGAVAVLFELVTSLNRLGDSGGLESPTSGTAEVRQAFEEGALLLKEMGQVLGLFFEAPVEKKLGGDDRIVAGLMRLLLDLRDNLRAEAKKIADKNDPVRKALFEQTDVIRKRLAEIGVTLEDRQGGTEWRIG